MVTRVVRVRARAAVGDTVMVDGRPLAVVALLPRLPGRRLVARATGDPPCGTCESALHWETLSRRWKCPQCHASYDAAALADLLREHLADGLLAGKGRRNRAARARQVVRGAPGAVELLQRAADEGGAPGRHDLFGRVDGPERRALRWALRNAGDAPLSAERCREAARELLDHSQPPRRGGDQDPPA